MAQLVRVSILISIGRCEKIQAVKNRRWREKEKDP